MEMRDIRGMTTPVAAKYLLDMLIEHCPKWAVVQYKYHGSNDSLDNEEMSFFATFEDYEGSDSAIVDKAEQPIPEELQRQVNELAYGLTEAQHGGWENNEGGHGTVDFILRPKPDDAFGPRVIQNHWDYVQEEVHRGETVY